MFSGVQHMPVCGDWVFWTISFSTLHRLPLQKRPNSIIVPEASGKLHCLDEHTLSHAHTHTYTLSEVNSCWSLCTCCPPLRHLSSEPLTLYCVYVFQRFIIISGTMSFFALHCRWLLVFWPPLPCEHVCWLMSVSISIGASSSSANK